MSDLSAFDVATTVIFADATLTPQVTPARAVHITQLREAINAVRAAAGLAPSQFKALVPSLIRRADIVELRAALDEARLALNLAALNYTDPSISTGVTRVKAAHVSELRDAVR